MKDYKFKIELDDKEYEFIFNLNVMQAIQDEYKSVQAWGELTDGKSGEVNAKALIFGFTEMLNEAIDINNDNLIEKQPLFTKKQVGRLITRLGLQESAIKLNNAIIESTKSDEKNV